MATGPRSHTVPDGKLDPLVRGVHRVGVHRVVVARRDEAAHGGIEPLGGKPAPPPRLGRDLAAELAVERGRVLAQFGELGGIQLRGVEAAPVDIGGELAPPVGGHAHLFAVDLGPQLVAFAQYRDQALAGEVAAQQQHVGFVDLGRGQELAEADIRTVHVGREEDPQCSFLLRLTQRFSRPRASRPPPR
jgi:hypothetical protein